MVLGLFFFLGRYVCYMSLGQYISTLPRHTFVISAWVSESQPKAGVDCSQHQDRGNEHGLQGCHVEITMCCLWDIQTFSIQQTIHRSLPGEVRGVSRCPPAERPSCG